ncbi:hypothetical protein EQV77_14615 [Halobacillus fulvus]|nr:hypothetical protein EQV77_14615 [Halobacillus fulvus]
MEEHEKIDPKTFNYLRMLGPRSNRQNAAVFLIVLLDLVGVLPLLGVPFSPALFWAGIIPATVMNLWGLLYIIAPYKFEKSYFLFIGVLGLVTTYVYFLVIQKFLYLHIGVESSFYFIFGLFLLLALLVSMGILNHTYFFGGSYYDPEKKSIGTFNTSPYVTASGVGYIIAQFIMSSFVTDSFQMVVLIAVMALLSVVTAFFATFLHRYFFIIENEQALKNTYHDFGLPKKLRNFQSSGGGDPMFFKKKKKEERYEYSLSVFVDEDYNEEEIDALYAPILDTDKISIATVITLPQLFSPRRKELEEAFPEHTIETPSLVVCKFGVEKLKEETKKMEKAHKYGFFKEIPYDEYLIVEDRVTHDYLNNGLLYTKDPDEVIRFMEYKDADASGPRFTVSFESK